jgi:hypothetical protein
VEGEFVAASDISPERISKATKKRHFPIRSGHKCNLLSNGSTNTQAGQS